MFTGVSAFQMGLVHIMAGMMGAGIAWANELVLSGEPIDAERGDDAVGKERGQDPYFTHVYRIGLDGKNNVSLTPDNGTHTAQVSPDGKLVLQSWHPESSLAEVGYCMHVARRLEYITETAAKELEREVKQVGAPLSGLIRSEKAKRSARRETVRNVATVPGRTTEHRQ
jgi:hypothetical protein